MFCERCGNEISGSYKFCTKCGSQAISPKRKNGIFFTKSPPVFWGAIILILLLIFYYRNQPIEEIRKDIASAVVNIYCEGASEEEASGGSGTILSEDGLVLTNAHIIPQGYKENEINCLVILPDPSTGSPKEIYYAYPIVAPRLSEKYDIAFVQIHDVFYDFKENRAYGEYPKKFPSYTENKRCSEENIKLGEPVRIYGYPAISGGYVLTITDGIVSSLLVNEGLIITSAKISYGNSGGLAVDQNGCMIGIPSMVTGDENESLGVIISNNLIAEFIAELELLEE